MQYGLKEDALEKIIGAISENPKIEKVLLYGSRAKGNYRNGSDIDLALLGEDIAVKDINAIALRFDDLYLPYDIDLTIYDRITNQELIEHINSAGITIYRAKSKSNQ